MVNLRSNILKLSFLYSVGIFFFSWAAFIFGGIPFIFNAKLTGSVSGANYFSALPINYFALFLLGQVIAYGILILIIATTLYGAEKTLLNKIKSHKLGEHLVALAIFYSIITTNKILYPASLHPFSTNVDFSELSLLNFLHLLPTFFFIALFATGTVRLYLNWPTYRKYAWGVTFIALITAMSINISNHNNTTLALKNAPNLIIIGIDSFDRSLLNKSTTSSSFINNFVNNAVHFSDTSTPLARTYVAWTSILTASYPVNHGVRFNLFPRDYMTQKPTLMKDFKSLGYQVFYSTDERRFANFDSYHDFEKIIGPPAGAADFLLGSASDMPVTNLFLSTTLGKLFFPFSTANRAVPHSYDYRNFLSLFNNETAAISKDKPLFLATHLCLGHWPYYHKHSNIENGTSPFLLYQKSMQSVDKMAQELFNDMKQKGLLENAIVVLLSDHGEGWPARRSSKQVSYSSYGHGNNVLDEDQQKVLFAVQRFKDGKAMYAPMTIDYPASLIDVLPTMVGLANINWSHKLDIDGYDLSPLVDKRSHNLPIERPRLIETEIQLRSIDNKRNGNIEMAEVVNESSQNYRLTKDGRFELTHKAVDDFLLRKNRAVELNGNYLYWGFLNGFKTYNSTTHDIRPFDDANLNDKKLKAHFCRLYAPDIKNGFLNANLCNNLK